MDRTGQTLDKMILSDPPKQEAKDLEDETRVSQKDYFRGITDTKGDRSNGV